MENFLNSNNDVNLDNVYSNLLIEYNNDLNLVKHRSYIEDNNLGFGEKPFHVMWRELVKKQPINFKFLEIGVYKGQVLSLIKLLSKIYKKNVEFYGVTPLTNVGDKFSNYENVNYERIIKNLFSKFELEIDIENNIIKGLSTDDTIKSKIKNLGFFDLLYIDGGHDYDCVVSDILLMKEISKKNTYVVFDDSSCYKHLSLDKFKGHIDVCNAIRDFLENDENFVEVQTVGHNRVFKRIN